MFGKKYFHILKVKRREKEIIVAKFVEGNFLISYDRTWNWIESYVLRQDWPEIWRFVYISFLDKYKYVSAYHGKPPDRLLSSFWSVMICYCRDSSSFFCDINRIFLIVFLNDLLFFAFFFYFISFDTWRTHTYKDDTYNYILLLQDIVVKERHFLCSRTKNYIV